MPPPLLLDLDAIDLQRIIYDTAAIEKINPHRYEMSHLDGIIFEDRQAGTFLGYKDVTQDEFWVRGHIPGRPVMPGVIMIEAAAQLASFFAHVISDNHKDRFVGFGGIEHAKFRGTVTPPARLYLLGKVLENRPRRFVCDAQGVVDGKMVFQAIIIGTPI